MWRLNEAAGHLLAETETHGDIPLYEALVRKLNQKGIQGASVLRGVVPSLRKLSPEAPMLLMDTEQL